MNYYPGATTRAFCLVCRAKGFIVGYQSPMISMRCPQCGSEWRTLSAICAKCKTPSGRPYYEPCEKCSDLKTVAKYSVKDHKTDRQQELIAVG